MQNKFFHILADTKKVLTMVNIFSFFLPKAKFKPQQHFLCIQHEKLQATRCVWDREKDCDLLLCISPGRWDTSGSAPTPRLAEPYTGTPDLSYGPAAESSTIQTNIGNITSAPKVIQYESQPFSMLRESNSSCIYSETYLIDGILIKQILKVTPYTQPKKIYFLIVGNR